MTTLRHTLILLLGLGMSGSGLLSQAASSQTDLSREERTDYYQKWLREDVLYLITPEEEAVFKKLATPEEKEQFIEQFWFRRDPDPSTAENEFKEEHYRRIAYANERFSSGLPGWMTDRGRIYIIHGPPAEIEPHPAGGYYDRPMHEGGGSTVTYPFEIWRYRYIEGIGTDIELEFVDPSMSGEYRLALMPEEKDAFLHTPGAGQTLAEELGLATRADRPYFSPGNRDRYPLMTQRAQDNPFHRYETYALVQRPAQIKYQDLKEMVKVNVSFNSLPLTVREDYFRLNDRQVLVPVTLQLDNRSLSFRQEGDQMVARVAVYGIVTSITNRVVLEFEDDLVTSFRPQELEAGLQRASIYQKIVPLEAKLKYKLDLVVQDTHSRQVGAVRRALVPPPIPTDRLAASSLLVTDSLRVLDRVPERDEMFVLGDVRVRPNLNRRFSSDDALGLYFHLYNASLDQSRLAPSLHLTYRLRKDGEIVRKLTDATGASIQYFSGQRVVVVKLMTLEGLEAGDYQVSVEVEDQLSRQSVEVSETFTVVPADARG
jgi:GWxTD domain-containing protein